MMAHNEKYKQSIEVADELYQDSMVPNAMMHTTEAIEEEVSPIRETYQVLNPASTTSSLERIERDAVINESLQQQQPMTANSGSDGQHERQSYAQVE